MIDIIGGFIHRVLVYCYLNLRSILHYCDGFINKHKKIIKNGKTIFLVGTPEHDNLGDHAIALAEIEFAQKYFPEYEVFEISVESWRRYYFALKQVADSVDMFFLTGGGNMGDVYYADEALRRVIINAFPDNRIVVFPQTVYFNTSEKGEREKEKSKAIYENHKHLLMCARETVSYERMKAYFPNCNVKCLPDIVFSLNISLMNSQSSGKIGVCIRSDGESTLNDKDKHIIADALSRYKTEEFSTCASSGISSKERTDRISKMLNQIASYDLVITDRLHALIFSYLVGTKCIVLPVKSSKITATIQWFKKDDAILYIPDTERLNETVEKMTNTEFSRLGNKDNDLKLMISDLARFISDMA